MITYSFSLQALEAEVEAEKPGWLQRAQAATEQFRQQNRYTGDADFWGEVKGVWIRLQRQKCAYCEGKYGDAEYAKINYDVEHYRPKSAVKAWPTSAQMKDNSGLSYGFPTGAASDTGYYLLAYNIKNYAVACKECNTIFKSNFFPIEAARHVDTDDYKVLDSEQPLLLFPIGEWGHDARAYIRFDGVMPITAATASREYRIARVTIDFFKLVYREELLRERCVLIVGLYTAYRLRHVGDPLDQQVSENTIGWMLASDAPHSSCLQDFYDLLQRDFEKARTYVVEASKLLKDACYQGRGFRDVQVRLTT